MRFATTTSNMMSSVGLPPEVELQKILSRLDSEDVKLQIHAIKVVANLSAEETNHQQILEYGGLTSLLMLLKSTKDETIHKCAAAAIANLALNITNHEMIVDQGGIGLLSSAAANAKDPQTLWMVGGAIANLCGNEKLLARLRSEGGVATLLGMVRCEHPHVIAQVARGMSNFSKCESSLSRASIQGTKKGKSLLVEEGALSWIVKHAKNETLDVRRHIELALCHLAQREANAKEMVKGRAMWELLRISRDSSSEDIKSIAHRTLTSSPTFLTVLKRLHVDPWEETNNAVCSSVVIGDMDHNFVDNSGMRNALKLVASCSAQEANLERIMERSFTMMLLYLRNSKDETVQRDAAFLIANSALSKTYQEIIMDKGCISLLWSAAATAQDPQTITMFAKAIANLCGNEELHTKLRSKGGIAALLEMAARSGHSDVFAEVARGFANFATSESTISTQGENRGKSTLIEDGALSWIIEKAKTEALTIRLHIDIALCRLAQHEANAEEMVKEGAMWELVRISRDSSREDLRILARQILTSSPIFLTDLKRVCAELRNIDGTSIDRENNLGMSTLENDLLQHINTIYEVVLEAEKENVMKATYYKGKEQLADLFTTLLETTWAEELKSKLGVTSKWIKKE